MSKPVLSAAAVLVLVALAGAFWLLLDSGQEHGGGSTTEAPPPSPFTTPSKPSSGGQSGDGKIEIARYSSTDPAEAAPPRVLVVDEEDRPVANATVDVLRSRGDMNGFRGIDFLNGDDVSRRALRTLKSDASGVVELDRMPRRQLELVGRADRRVGGLELDPRELSTAAANGNGEFRLVLKPIKSVDVEVVDASGSPVPGVRVRATIPDEMRPPARHAAWTSDPEGRAMVELTSLDGSLYDAPELAIQATLPGLPPVNEPVAPKEGTIRATVHVPTVVLARVTVKVPESETAPKEMTLQWNVVPQEGDLSGPRAFGAMFGGGLGQRTFTGTKVVVGGFAPGSSGRFTLTSDERIASHLAFKIPTDAKSVTFEIQLGKKQPYLTARMVDDAGHPITDGAFAYEVSQTLPPDPGEPAATEVSVRTRGRGMNGPGFNRGGRQTTVEPDESGMVKIAVAPDVAGSLKVYDTESPDLFGDRPTKAALERAFDAVPAGSTVTIKDLVIPRRPVIVAGVVKTSAGKPVEGARVTLDLAQIQDFNPELFALLRDPARTNDKGRFEVRGNLTGSLTGARLVGRTRGARSQPKDFAQGETDLEIVVEPTGSIAGSVKLASAELKKRVDVEVFTADRANDQSGRGRRGRFGGGPGNRTQVRPEKPAFEIRDLAAGRYDVQFTYDGQEALIVEGVEVRSGETSQDARLAAVILGANALIANVLVITPDGKPFQGADVSFDTGDNGGGGGPGGWRGNGRDRKTTDKDGLASMTFIEAPAAITVRVRAAGYTDQSFEKPPFPIRVTLDKGCELSVLFDIPGGLPALDGISNYTVRASLQTEAPAALPAENARMGRRGGGGGNGPAFGGARGRMRTATVAPGATSATLTGLSAGNWDISLSPVRQSVTEAGNTNFASMFTMTMGSIPLSTTAVPAGSSQLQVHVKVDEKVVTALRELQAAPAPQSTAPQPPNGRPGGGRPGGRPGGGGGGRPGGG